MGMFNLILADLMCPVKRQIGTNTDIQIKWQKREMRTLSAYHLGDLLEDIEPEFDNHWIRTDYICEVCSNKTTGYREIPYVRVDDQQRHHVFVKIEKSKVVKILTEEEFKEEKTTDFIDYL